MDYLFFLERRLSIAEHVYETGRRQYVETMRRIDEGEPPYDNCGARFEGDDEPAFLEEWMQAHHAADVIGMSSLGLTLGALQALLFSFVRSRFGEQVKKGKGGWLADYREFFECSEFYRWSNCDADFPLLEQAILTRNNFQHNLDLLSLETFQDEQHVIKHPASAFADPFWPTTAWDMKARLEVPDGVFRNVCAAVRELARHLIVTYERVGRA